MKATDVYRKINNSPINGIILYYTEKILQMDKVPLGSVISQIKTGKTPPKSNPKYYSSSDINWYKSSDIGYGKYLTDAKEKFSNIAVAEKKATIFSKDTLLIIGIGGGVGRVSILKEKGSSNQQITGITFSEKVCPQYAYYYYLVREKYIKSQAKSMSFPILNQSKIKELEFKYPSISEQNEFVKFVDACFNSFLKNKAPNISDFEISSDLKEYALKQFRVIELNNKVQKNIKNELSLLSKLKQSILQEAIEGKLTEDWRKQNPNIETASKLLERVKAEKEQLIADKKIRKEKPLPSITKEETPFELPDGWVCCRLGDICTKLTDGFHHTPIKKSSGYKYISPKNLNNNKVNWSNCEFIDKKDHDYLQKKVDTNKGDILIANRGTVGTPVIIDIEEKFSFQNLAIIGFNQEKVSPEYVFYYVLSKQKEILDFFVNGGLQPMLSNKRLQTLIVPLPSFEEQKVIGEKLDKFMKKYNDLEAEIKNSEANAQMLIQSVLKEVFDNQ